VFNASERILGVFDQKIKTKPFGKELSDPERN
jgi:hypothetical protein